MKNAKLNAFLAVIVFSLAACGTSGGKGNAGTFLDGSWINTSENDTCHIELDGNNWTFYDGDKPVSKGTLTVSVKPAAETNGTVTFTITHVAPQPNPKGDDKGKDWVGLPSEHKKIKTCTVKYSIDSGGNEITLSGKQLAAFDPTGIWKKIEGIYIRGSSRRKGGSGGGSGGNADGKGSTGGSASQGAKGSSTTADSPFIYYVITGKGTSFTATKNGAVVGTANQEIADVIDDIRIDANGANAAIQFGNGASVLDIGAASVRFGSDISDIWGSIALSGRITSSASPAIGVYSGFVTSVADISTTYTPRNGSGSAIDNSGTLVINGGTVSATSANTYGIRNHGGRVIINSGNVSPRGEGIYNDNSSGKGGNVFITGGTVQSQSSRAIYNMNGCTVTITGGTVSSFSSETIYNPGGAVKIEGGTVSGGNAGHAIWNTNSGTVTITGGTVSMINLSGTYAAINNDSGCTVTITGGSVLAPKGGKAISNESGATATVTSPPAVIIGSM